MILNNASEQISNFIGRLRLKPAVLVQVDATEGSAPREAGSWMAVFPDALVGSIGGGHLEFAAIAAARTLLSSAQGCQSQGLRLALGPSLGQCCGGVVYLGLRRVSAADALALAANLEQALARTLNPAALFGGGHVGQALVRVLANLPFALSWIDSRDGVFPENLPANVVCEHSDPVHSAVPGLAPQSNVLVMSFSHAEDLDVVAACLQRQRDRSDLPFVGLIGSRTKWATFRHRLEAQGFTPAELAHVTCPIGVSGIEGKEPDVIAVAVAAQLLQTVQAVSALHRAGRAPAGA